MWQSHTLSGLGISLAHINCLSLSEESWWEYRQHRLITFIWNRIILQMVESKLESKQLNTVRMTFTNYQLLRKCWQSCILRKRHGMKDIIRIIWNVATELVFLLLAQLTACTCARSHSMVVHSNPLWNASVKLIMISFFPCLLETEWKTMNSIFKGKQ